MTETIKQMQRLRRRRFRREPEFRPEGSRAGRIELRKRDLDIITAVAKHRFLNTEHVCRLFACACPKVEKDGIRGGKPAKVWLKEHRPNCACTCGVNGGKKEHAPGCPALFKDDQHVASRLRELYQAGYLERPIAQLQLRVKDGVIGEGSVPMVYAVTSEGLAIIGSERRKALGVGKMSWVKKNNEGGRVFMEHTLSIADVSIGLDSAVRSRPHLERLSDDLLQAGLSEERKRSGRLWNLKVKYKSVPLSAVCDLAFAVGDTIQRKRWNFLVEVDRGQMPIERSSFKQTSIMRKLVAFAKAYEDELHKTEFGWKGFRVLILTTSEERVMSCLDAARRRFGTASVARVFLFGTLDASEDLLSYKFWDSKGNRVGLIE